MDLLVGLASLSVFLLVLVAAAALATLTGMALTVFLKGHETPHRDAQGARVTLCATCGTPVEAAIGAGPRSLGRT